MKPYPPVLKENKRYVLFEVVSDRKFGKEDVKRAVSSILQENLGNLGLADAEYAFIDFDEATQKGILRCKTKRLGEIRAALAILSEINLYKAFLYIRAVAGSIKKAKSVI